MIEDPKPETNQILLEALEQRWKSYHAELKRCRAEFSNEAVHDLLVSLRSPERKGRGNGFSLGRKVQTDLFETALVPILVVRQAEVR